MAETVYTLGALLCLACALLLLRQYRTSGQRLLLWSGLCFVGLTLNNALVFVDLVLVPDVDLRTWRLCIAALATSTLAFGLVWESRA